MEFFHMFSVFNIHHIGAVLYFLNQIFKMFFFPETVYLWMGFER